MIRIKDITLVLMEMFHLVKMIMNGVANIVGGNAGNVIRDNHLEELFNIDKIRAQEEGKIFYINKQKLNPFTAHSFIYAGQETTTPSYRKWQKIRNGYDGILRIFNSDTYKDFFYNKKEEKMEVVKMKNRIKYLVLFTIVFTLTSCSRLFEFKPYFVTGTYNDDIYGIIENGIIPKEKIVRKERDQGDIWIEYSYPAPVDITKTNDDSYILEIGEIEILDKNGKVIKAKEKIPPLLFKKTMVRALKKNFIGSEDIYYRGWAEDYLGNLNELKKLKK